MGMRDDIKELLERVEELEGRLDAMESDEGDGEDEDGEEPADEGPSNYSVLSALMKHTTEFQNFRGEFKNKLTDVDNRIGAMNNRFQSVADSVMKPVSSMNAAAEKCQQASQMLIAHLGIRGKIARSVRAWRDVRETDSWMSKMNTLADAIEKPGFGEENN